MNIEFNRFFNDEYQFTLNNVTYTRLESDNIANELSLNISDTINSTVKEHGLDAVFQRKIFFIPEAMYEIEVSFAFTLAFKDCSVAEEAKNINWSDELMNSHNPYLNNIISRASHLISDLTSSYGQQPLVTPPNIVREK